MGSARALEVEQCDRRVHDGRVEGGQPSLVGLEQRGRASDRSKGYAHLSDDAARAVEADKALAKRLRDLGQTADILDLGSAIAPGDTMLPATVPSLALK